MNRADAVCIAQECAAKKPESYYAEPFEPHEWVVDAVLAAANAGAAKFARDGEVIPADQLLLSVRMGTAQLGDREYQILTGPGGNPCIRSCATGKTYCLGWPVLLTMALYAGIDDA